MSEHQPPTPSSTRDEASNDKTHERPTGTHDRPLGAMKPGGFARITHFVRRIDLP